MRRTGSRGHEAAAEREGFEPVATVLENVLLLLKLETRFAAAEATERWADAVGKETGGPEALARTNCVGVRDGELLVEVQGATWMGHLAVLRQGILERMNRELQPEQRIRAIRFVPMRSKEVRKR
ncbi:MAG TPA: DciA family protein [Candidatus Dormibacteraeota bacterium]|nr:DciA family protein [Candidatus Dormibacteraeota bacterium]